MIPKFGPEQPLDSEPHDPSAPKSPWDRTEHVTVSPEDLVRGDGKSTLILALRMGLADPDSEKAGEYLMMQAIPAQFLDFLRTKDTEGILRNSLADYLHEIAEQWRNGDIFRG